MVSEVPRGEIVEDGMLVAGHERQGAERPMFWWMLAQILSLFFDLATGRQKPHVEKDLVWISHLRAQR